MIIIYIILNKLSIEEDLLCEGNLLIFLNLLSDVFGLFLITFFLFISIIGSDIGNSVLKLSSFSFLLFNGIILLLLGLNDGGEQYLIYININTL